MKLTAFLMAIMLVAAFTTQSFADEHDSDSPPTTPPSLSV